MSQFSFQQGQAFSQSFFADFLDDGAHPRRRALALAIQALLFVVREVAAQFPDDVILQLQALRQSAVALDPRPAGTDRGFYADMP